MRMRLTKYALLARRLLGALLPDGAAADDAQAVRRRSFNDWSIIDYLRTPAEREAYLQAMAQESGGEEKLMAQARADVAAAEKRWGEA